MSVEILVHSFRFKPKILSIFQELCLNEKLCQTYCQQICTFCVGRDRTIRDENEGMPDFFFEFEEQIFKLIDKLSNDKIHHAMLKISFMYRAIFGMVQNCMSFMLFFISVLLCLLS